MSKQKYRKEYLSAVFLKLFFQYVFVTMYEFIPPFYNPDIHTILIFSQYPF